MAEILSTAVQSNDYPVCVPTITLPHRWIWVVTDGF
jgi:hypothetical protein